MIDLIKQLLERDIKKRLGVKKTGGYENLKKHAIFAKFDWEMLENKKVTPSFIPDVF
jgi:hypothetical protein